MISSKSNNFTWMVNLKAIKEDEYFDGIVASIDVISKEQQFSSIDINNSY